MTAAPPPLSAAAEVSQVLFVEAAHLVGQFRRGSVWVERNGRPHEGPAVKEARGIVACTVEEAPGELTSS